MKRMIDRIAALSVSMILLGCSDDAPRIEWDCRFTPDDNFEVFISPEFHPSVMIDAGKQEGSVTLTSINYGEIRIVDNDDYHLLQASDLSVEQTAANELTITFSATDDDQYESFFMTVAGVSSSGHALSTVGITRNKR